MRAYPLIVLSILLTGCIAGHTGRIFWPDTELVPAHISRAYASFSQPAFDASGVMYFVNGESLLRFGQDGQRLSPLSLPPLDNVYYQSPQAYGTTDGTVYVLPGNGLIGLIDSGGQLQWLVDYLIEGTTAYSWADGLLVNEAAGDYPLLLLDAAGDDVLRLLPPPPSPDGSRGYMTVGGQRHLFFLVEGKLTTYDDHGDLVADTRSIASYYSYVCSAIEERALIVDGAAAICVNAAGDEMWRLVLAPPYSDFNSGMLLDDGSAAIPVSTGLTMFGLLFANADGQIEGILSLPGTTTVFPAGNSYLVQYYDGPHRLLARYTRSGSELWRYTMPEYDGPDTVESGQVVPIYPESLQPYYAPDGRIYFQANNMLCVLSSDGQLLWQEPSNSWNDEWIEEGYRPVISMEH